MTVECGRDPPDTAFPVKEFELFFFRVFQLVRKVGQ